MCIWRQQSGAILRLPGVVEHGFLGMLPLWSLQVSLVLRSSTKCVHERGLEFYCREGIWRCWFRVWTRTLFWHCTNKLLTQKNIQNQLCSLIYLAVCLHRLKGRWYINYRRRWPSKQNFKKELFCFDIYRYQKKGSKCVYSKIEEKNLYNL